MVLALTLLLAQPDRAELARRLRAFEEAWEKADAEGRRRAIPHLQSTANALASKPDEAARALATARRSLATAEAPKPEAMWAESLQFRLESRLANAGEATIAFTLSAAWKAGEIPRGAKLLVAIGSTTPVETDVDELPLKGKLTYGRLEPGDHVARWEVVVGSDVVDGRMTFACIDNVAARLAALKKTLDALEAKDTVAQTRRSHLRVLQALAERKPADDVPAARFLVEAEKGPEPGRAGDHWVTFATRKGDVPARMMVPAGDGAKPLVIALHGAGGNENTLFDVAARPCRERGWILATPRSAGKGSPAWDVIDAVDAVTKVDRAKVFLVGHSMGAMQAVEGAGQSPERIAGVAALGGGGTPAPGEKLRDVAFFVGVGAHDFALDSAKALAEKLRKAEVRRVELKEYADVEHLMAPRAAISDACRFLEGR